jgi:F0F1-type ATP synthase assembly protein I
MERRRVRPASGTAGPARAFLLTLAVGLLAGLLLGLLVGFFLGRIGGGGGGGGQRPPLPRLRHAP